MLEPRGVIANGKSAGISQLRVCLTCLADLQARKLPSWALANFNWYGPQRLPALSLTVPEEQFLCTFRVCMKIFVLRPTTTTKKGSVPANQLQRFCTGDCITIPHDPGKAIRSVQLKSQEDFADVIKVFWVGKEKPARDHPLLKRFFNLSLRKLRAAHQILTSDNHLRRGDATFDFRNFEDDVVPQSIYSNIELVEDENFVLPVGAGQSPVPLSSEADVIRTSGVLDMDGESSLNENQLLRSAAAAYLQQDSPEIVVTADTDKPVVEYDNPLLWALGFLLFEKALGLPDDPLRAKYGRKLTLEEWAERCLSICDHRFRLHRSFIFVISNVLLRRQVCLHARIHVNKSFFASRENLIDKLQSAQLPESDMQRLLEAVLANKTSDLPPGLKELLSSITAVGGKTQQGYFARRSLRNRLYARNICYGQNNIFFSGSPAESKSALVCYYHGLRDIDLDARCPDLPSSSVCREIAASDPVAVVKAFLVTLEAFQHELLGWERHKQSAVQTEHGGAYGKLACSAVVKECSGRGVFHWHGLARFLGFPPAREFADRMQNDDEYRKEVLAFFDCIISQGLPDASVHAMFGGTTTSTGSSNDTVEAELHSAVSDNEDSEKSESEDDTSDLDLDKEHAPQAAEEDEDALAGKPWTLPDWQKFLANEPTQTKAGHMHEHAGFIRCLTDDGQPIQSLLQCVAYVMCLKKQFHTSRQWQNKKTALADRVNDMVLERLKRDTSHACYEGVPLSTILVAPNWNQWIESLASETENQQTRLGELPFLAALANVIDRNVVIFVPTQQVPIVVRCTYKSVNASLVLAAEHKNHCILLEPKLRANEDTTPHDLTTRNAHVNLRDCATVDANTVDANMEGIDPIKPPSLRRRHADTLRCPNPNDPDYMLHVQTDSSDLCRAQLHKCTPSCFKYWKPGQPRRCRSRYGREGRALNAATTLDDVGNVVLKRTHTHINNYNPAIMLAIRCNQDIQLLVNQRDGNSVEHYLASKYVLKDYADESVVLPILVAALKRREQQQDRRIAMPTFDTNPSQTTTRATQSPAISPAGDRSRKLIIRVCNKLNGLQTRSGSEAALFLLRGSLLTFSDSDETLHLASAIGCVETAFGEKSGSYANNTMLMRSRMLASGKRVFYTVNQYTDYRYRSPKLKYICMYLFVAMFVKVPIARQRDDSSAAHGRGRPRQQCFPFRQRHPEHEFMHLRLRTYAVVPVFEGPTVPPKSKDPEKRAKILLVVFKPFTSPRNLRRSSIIQNAGSQTNNDVNSSDSDSDTQTDNNFADVEARQIANDAIPLEWQTTQFCGTNVNRDSASGVWQESFDSWVQGDECPGWVHSKLANIEHMVEGHALAAQHAAAKKAGTSQTKDTSIFDYDSDDEKLERDFLEQCEMPGVDNDQENDLTPAVVVSESVRHTIKAYRETNPDIADRAISSLTKNLFFNCEHKKPATATAHKPTSFFKNVTSQSASLNETGIAELDQLREEKLNELYDIPEQTSSDANTSPALLPRDHVLIVRKEFGLEEEGGQRDAYMLHALMLVAMLERENVPQMQIVVWGPAGTGKTQVAQAYRELAVRCKALHRIRFAAMQAMQAHAVNGSTWHYCFGMGIHAGAKPNKSQVQKIFQHAWHMWGDEFSNMAAAFLAVIGRNIKIAKPNVKQDSHLNGLSSTWSGDFGQLPPVNGDVLYRKTKRPETDVLVGHIVDGDKNSKRAKAAKAAAEKRRTDSSIGCEMWLQRTHVVICSVQKRMTDQKLLGIATRMRAGQGTTGSEPTSDYQQLRKHTLETDDKNTRLRFAREATVLVPTNKPKLRVDRVWATNVAKALGVPVLVSIAADTFRAMLTDDQRVEASNRPDTHCGGLPGLLDMVYDLEVMIRKSPYHILNIANGVRGKIVKVFLDPIDHNDLFGPLGVYTTLQPGERYYLKCPAHAIWILLNEPGGLHLKGFPPGVVPIQRTSATTSNFRYAKGKYTSLSRTQVPVVGCKAMTFQISQGQNMRCGLLDFFREGRGRMDPRGPYVGLSRFSKMDDFRMVRDFDPALLRTPPPQDMLKEEEDFRVMALKTKQQLLTWERNFLNGKPIFTDVRSSAYDTPESSAVAQGVPHTRVDTLNKNTQGRKAFQKSPAKQPRRRSVRANVNDEMETSGQEPQKCCLCDEAVFISCPTCHQFLCGHHANGSECCSTRTMARPPKRITSPSSSNWIIDCPSVRVRDTKSTCEDQAPNGWNDLD